MWIQTGVTVRKQLNGVMTSVTLTFDLWPWAFAWTWCLSMVITPENFRMIKWEEHCQKGVTDGQTDGQMEISVLRAAWSQLKTYHTLHSCHNFPVGLREASRGTHICETILLDLEVLIVLHSLAHTAQAISHNVDIPLPFNFNVRNSNG